MSTKPKNRERDARESQPAEGAGAGAGETLHAHLHEHADGTVHNHFHRHAHGDTPHTHDGDHLPVHADEGALPEHAHRHSHASRLILEAKGVSFRFPRAARPVFEDISFEAHAGTMTAILGNNGAGKSTLLNILGNIAAPTTGTVSVGGESLTHMNRRAIAQHIAYVTQQQRVPHLSAYDEVLLGRKPHVSWSIGERDRAVVAAAIERLELEPFVDRFCDELSGGERQKVYIARALAQETEVLLLDEPTSALDPKNQMEVLRAVREITTQTSLATVMVIHDINLALRFCDNFLLMRNGVVVAHGGIESVTEEALSFTYDLPLRLVDVDGMKMAVA
ncbi:MAG: ATP-binding cassette domain-containing protein [Eggerthellaceae bacterium]|nr:ATP-binding cassette domain-containing protein [Eggerthellaceae bacterium]